MSLWQRSAPRGLLLVAAIAAPCLTLVRLEMAMAQGDEEPIRLDYRAGPGCLDEDSFVALVRARTPRVRLIDDGGRARTFQVRLAATARPSGSVTVVDGVRTEGTRTVDADTCAEVADELSLIVALALDPHATTPSTPPPASAAPPTAAPGDAGAPSVSLAPAPSAPPPPTDPSPPTPTASGTRALSGKATEALAPAVESGSAPAPLGLHFFAGVDLAVASGVAPTTIVGGAPYIGWRSTGASRIGLSVRAAFLRIGTGALATPGGTADFTWTVGRVDACGLLWPDRAFRPGGCARVEAGALDGSGHQIVGAQSQLSPWVTGGALARVEWTFLGMLLLDVEAGPTFRLNSDRFYFFPNTTVYQVPTVGLDAEAGLGVHFL
jgi:hypothetical protein